MKSAAFTLIEVLVGITLSGFLMVLLISSVFQFVRSAEYVEIATDTVIQQTVTLSTLERDLSGMFIPQYILQIFGQAFVETKESEKQVGTKGKETPKEEPREQREDESFELPPFICKTERNRQSITRFEFFTNNSPAGFWSEQVGTPQTKIAYVSYWLEQKKDSAQLFDLIRSKQVVEFKIKRKGGPKKVATSIIGDTIATNVVDFNAQFITIIPPSDPKKAPKVSRQDQLTMQPEKMLKQIKKDPDSISAHLFINAVRITLTIENQRGTQHQFSQLIMVGSQPILEDPQEAQPEERGNLEEQKE